LQHLLLERLPIVGFDLAAHIQADAELAAHFELGGSTRARFRLRYPAFESTCARPAPRLSAAALSRQSQHHSGLPPASPPVTAGPVRQRG
jgi:hypothetical protein